MSQMTGNQEKMAGISAQIDELIPNDQDTRTYWEIEDLTSIQIALPDQQGALFKILDVFRSHSVNMTRILSKPDKMIDGKMIVNFQADFNGRITDSKVQNMIKDLETVSEKVTILTTPEVPWFPTQIYDFDHIGKRILGAGDGIQDTDHPGFNDAEYRKRRAEITQAALKYKLKDETLPFINYNEREKEVWKYCYPRLTKLFETNACEEFNWTIEQFQKHVGFSQDNIPQLNDISQYLQSQTGWRLKPVGGLLTQREFLNGLAFKVFHSTQYIRHHSVPLYTPEPDIIHELLGHAPMFAHKDFADFSQEIGIASLGANERDLNKLAAIYWFTIEFGMCKEKGGLKAYGAGILSSVGELEYCVSDKPKYLPLDPFEIAQNHLDYPISSMQPLYFVAESFAEAKQQITNYCEQINKPFNVTYDVKTNSVIVDRKIKTRKEIQKGPLF
ncbi:phenylalanine 4-monooxygenase [Stylonychia lemnae]|uniref:phenylalanine 4-monooxygenase n=1 Tax=Stylonychia lemnae TaxID=5949 RepID=A0A078A6W0_STYLE|nr:phenylalanine 4-monooxygenase [Stylonychia lemnae]|eukprot:CDW76459.1 phenylalanine 4-monooxygenase [Stylonychia lemnae]